MVVRDQVGFALVDTQLKDKANQYGFFSIDAKRLGCTTTKGQQCTTDK